MTADNAEKYLMIAGGVLLLGAVLYIMTKGVRGTATAAAKAVTDAATGAAGGVVQSIGETVGIPPTDPDKCAQAMKDGRTLDASFYCDAGTFARYVFSSKSDTASQ